MSPKALGCCQLLLSHSFKWIFKLLIALAVVSAPASAQSQGERRADFDRRQTRVRLQTAPQNRQLDALSELRDELSGELLTSFDDSSGVTRSIFNPVGKLSPPLTGDRLEAAMTFVRSNLGLLGLQEGDLDETEVCDLVYSRVSDSTHIYLCQQYRSLPIINAQLQINMSSDGSIMSINNSFVPGLRRQAKPGQARIGAPDAVLAAANHLLLPRLARPRIGLGQQETQSRVSMPSSDLSTEPIRAELSWLPEGRNLNLVWRFLVHTPDQQHVYDITVDAESGPDTRAVDDENRVWTRYDMVLSDQYRVYPLPVESPFHTTPAPPEDARMLVVNPADASASMLGWHDTGGETYEHMRGNNVHAYADTDANDQPPATEPSCGSSLNCNFPLDLSLQPDTYTEAAVANLFYWNNIVHDIQYLYGFDEQAGNFQVNNFGRGGAGGDDVRAEAQDGGGTSNANFLTLPDGSRPRMQMYLWDRTSPMRDGSLDAGIVVHEYGHGISIRIVGGPSNVSCLQNQQQPGEGLSDWWTLVYTAKPSDEGTDARGVGTYVFSQNGDVGVRTQLYSTDPAINTHTYESINGMAVPHGVGEVWAQVAWEAYWALVNIHGFDPDLYNVFGGSGNQRMMLYVNEGLKNTACSPTFTDVRDGIIQAAGDNYGGEDVCTLWQAFADFGLGVDAVSGGSNSTAPTNGFDVPLQCIGGTLEGIVESDSGTPISNATVQAGGFSATTNSSGFYSLALPAGTYDVTASAFGFTPSTVSGIVVDIDSNVVNDFVLTSLPHVEVSGTVRDGSDAGWPLYARVDVTAVGPQFTQTYYTNPTTGQYGPIHFVQGETYDVAVTSLLAGYHSETRTVSADADSVEEFFLLVDLDVCTAPGYALDQPLFVSEGFEGSFPPAGWSVSHSTTGCSLPGLPEWTNTDPGGRSNFTGGSGLFAIADSDACGPGASMDTVLESPLIDLSELGTTDTLRIEFKHLFTQFSGNEAADVDLWNGSSWLNLQSYGGGGYASGTIVLNASDANGITDARLRFHYAANYDFWWELDDVKLSVGPGAPQCSFRGGGLVWGLVSDQSTGAAVNGANVTVMGGSSTQSMPTPQDPNLPDGFYILGADAGLTTITALASGYGSVASDITVPAGGVVELDFAMPDLPSVHFSAADYSAPEGNGSATITVRRTGSATGAFSVDYATNDGTANEGTDYVDTSGTVSFADGDMEDKAFVIPLLEDTIVEGDEWVHIVLSNPSSGAVLGTPATAVLTIHDNEAILQTVWVEDTVPAGGSRYGTWDWVSSDPTPFSGSVAHQSSLTAGIHQHYFVNATETLSVEPDDVLFAYVYLDPANPPNEVMLQWSDGTWEHRAYWGANSIPWGTDGSDSRRFMGPLPPAGRWARLEIDAADLGLEGKVLNGMAFTLYDGRATWDYAGKYALPPPPSVQFKASSYWSNEGIGQAVISVMRTGGSSGSVSVDYVVTNGTATAGSDYTATSGTITFPEGDSTEETFVVSITDDAIAEGVETIHLDLTNPSTGVVLGSPNTAVLNILDNEVFAETIWVDDATPQGGSLGGPWNWVSSNPDPFSGSLSHQSALSAGMHQHYFVSVTETLSVEPGDTLFSYVFLDPSNPPSEVMLQWYDGTWEHRAYWGNNDIDWGDDGTESRRFMGPLPPTGQWERLEVPVSELGLEGTVLTGLAFVLFDGRATWDYAGKSSAPPPPSVQFDEATYSIAEDANEATITVTRTGSGNGAVTIDYITRDQTATSGEDYAYTSGTISFADGDSTDKTLVVPITDDGTAEGDETFDIELSNPTGGVLIGSPASAAVTIMDDELPPETIWMEDGVPGGARAYGTWNWVSANPDPYSGGLAHQSRLASGIHQHYFVNATETLSVGDGETLFCYVYVDPINPPSEIMLQWSDGTFAHRAYWGANSIDWGADGTNARRYMGALPPAGQWVRLDVSASDVGLEGRVLKGMAFTLYNGRATWDYAGKSTLPPASAVQFESATYRIAEDGVDAIITVARTRNSTGAISVDYTASDGSATPGDDFTSTFGTLVFPDGDMTDKSFSVPILEDTLSEGAETIELTLSNPFGGAILGGVSSAVLTILDNEPLTETVWVEDAAPSGAGLYGTWNWVGSNPVPFSGNSAHKSTLSSSIHQHYFVNASERISVGAGDTLFGYVYLDPSSPPGEIMLQWYDGTWGHRAYWGDNSIPWGVDGTDSRRFMGPLPPTGQWVRLEVPVHELGLEGTTLSGMAFTLFGGRATWDYAGKTSAAEPLQLTSPTSREDASLP